MVTLAIHIWSNKTKLFLLQLRKHCTVTITIISVLLVKPSRLHDRPFFYIHKSENIQQFSFVAMHLKNSPEIASSFTACTETTDPFFLHVLRLSITQPQKMNWSAREEAVINDQEFV